MRRSLPYLIAVLAMLGCGSGSFDGRVYQGQGMAFRVGPVPGEWRRIDADQTLLAFRDHAARATIAVNGRCGEDADDVPLQALTQHLFLQFTDRQIRSQKLLELDGREALRTEMSAKLDGVPMQYVVIVLKKNGCVYDFLYIAEPHTGADPEAGFEGFVRGFATLREPS